ncbi:uncharacterized protein LOC124248121 [Equus quagga]|uniref:uncharacterized protein LOC124248121 n=1 Tax=Equus quagga TaxID=89248 RepID=UPI001EE2DDFC|nr:uncharacterized protein LOC124248121 [Equus quagga]
MRGAAGPGDRPSAAGGDAASGGSRLPPACPARSSRPSPGRRHYRVSLSISAKKTTKILVWTTATVQINLGSTIILTVRSLPTLSTDGPIAQKHRHERSSIFCSGLRKKQSDLWKTETLIFPKDLNTESVGTSLESRIPEAIRDFKDIQGSHHTTKIQRDGAGPRSSHQSSKPEVNHEGTITRICAGEHFTSHLAGLLKSQLCERVKKVGGMF